MGNVYAAGEARQKMQKQMSKQKISQTDKQAESSITKQIKKQIPNQDQIQPIIPDKSLNTKPPKTRQIIDIDSSSQFQKNVQYQTLILTKKESQIKQQFINLMDSQSEQDEQEDSSDQEQLKFIQNQMEEEIFSFAQKSNLSPAQDLKINGIQGIAQSLENEQINKLQRIVKNQHLVKKQKIQFQPKDVIYWQPKHAQFSTQPEKTQDQIILEQIMEQNYSEQINRKFVLGYFQTRIQTNQACSQTFGQIIEIHKKPQPQKQEVDVENIFGNANRNSEMPAAGSYWSLDHKQKETQNKYQLLYKNKKGDTIAESRQIIGFMQMKLRHAKQSKSDYLLQTLKIVHQQNLVIICTKNIQEDKSIPGTEISESQNLICSHSVVFDLLQYYKNAAKTIRNQQMQQEKESKSTSQILENYFKETQQNIRKIISSLKDSLLQQQNVDDNQLQKEDQQFQLNKQLNRQGGSNNNSFQPKNAPNIKQLFQSGNFFALANGQVQPFYPSSYFVGELRKYQNLALSWMLYRQGCPWVSLKQQRPSLHYDWKELNPKRCPNLFVNSSSRQFLTFRPKIQKKCIGGILADQMGLGKTIISIALIATHIKPKSYKQWEAGNLIVVPLSVLYQWRYAIEKHAPHLKLIVIHTGDSIYEERISNADIVLTTQGILTYQFKKFSKKLFQPTLFQFEWFRLFIDEAHKLRNIQGKFNKAASTLNCTYKWLLTGTPIHNKLEDMVAYFKVIQYKPWDEKLSISIFSNKGFPKSDRSLTEFKQILKGVLVRRKKNFLLENGQKILDLEDFDSKVISVEFNQIEKQKYRKFAFNLLTDIQNIFQNHIFQNNNGKREQQWSFTKDKKTKKYRDQMQNQLIDEVFTKMMKMRQFCCHQYLQKSKSTYIKYECFYQHYSGFLMCRDSIQGKYKKDNRVLTEQDFVERLRNQAVQRDKESLRQLHTYLNIMNRQRLYCEICKKTVVNGLLTKCLHLYCQGCLKNYWDTKKQQQKFENEHMKKSRKYYVQCVNLDCSSKIYYRQQLSLPRINMFNFPIQKIMPNDKIIQLIDRITELKDQKSIVFTQFLGMIQILEEMFNRTGITFISMTGSDTYQKRAQKIDKFEHSNLQVFLISTKCGYAGLNLQMANNMFFMDPWWNPAIQDQAIGRIHRIGQTKKVIATRFITKDSIEQSINLMCQEKRVLYDFVLDSDSSKKRKKKMKKLQWLKAALLLSLQKCKEEKHQKSSKKPKIKRISE